MMRALALTFCLLPTIALGQGDSLAGSTYCGVYSFYAAVNSLGQETSLRDLIDEKYISSSLGSTLLDLKRAANDRNLHSLPMRGMTTGMLRDATSPVLLHVRTARRGSPFHHWIVYLGVENGHARIVDPPAGVELVSFADVASRWDGVGLVVSAHPISSWHVARIGWIEQCLVLLSAAIVLFLVFAFANELKLPWQVRKTSIGVVCILASSAGVGLIYHASMAEGFARNPNSVASVMTAHHATHLNELTTEAVRSALERRAVIIDARAARAYTQDHIPTAISIPITLTYSQRTRAIANSVPRDAEIIVYCQSDKCAWSDELGSDLIFRGYKNVHIYRGGFREWKTTQH